jgi:uncharacterized integral membrane protein (TIGR00698 family)
VLAAVLIGALWRNTLGVHRSMEAGLQWAASFVLRFGIALVGLRLTLMTVGQLGLYALPIVIACIATAMLFVRAIAARFRLSATLAQLLAVGTAVCGCTAIMAVAPVIRARQEEMGYAVGCVVLFGLLAMLSYPWLAHAAFTQVPLAAGLFLGTAIHDTSQVIGAGLIYAQQFDAPLALESATTAKLFRNLSMVILIPWFAYSAAKHLARESGSTNRGPVARPGLSKLVPVFVWFFLGFVVVRTIGDVLFTATAGAANWSEFMQLSSRLAEFCLVAGMAAVGLGIRFDAFGGIGARPVGAAMCVALAVGIVSFAATSLVVRFAL